MIYNELTQRGTLDFPVEFYHIERNNTRYEMTAHWHSEIEIIRVLDGELRCKFNNQSYVAKRGDILFVNSECVHSAMPEDCVYECVVFHMDFLYPNDDDCRFFIDNVLNHEYVLKEYYPCDNSIIYKTFNEIFDALKNKNEGYKFYVIGSFYRLFGLICEKRLYENAVGSSLVVGKNVPKLKNILTYIRRNYDKHIYLEEMAEVAGMSPKYFCAFFKEMTGRTPVEYLKIYRIEKASRKLLNTDEHVTDIAYSCGFNDLSYFIKTFKELKNITPAQYRKR